MAMFNDAKFFLEKIITDSQNYSKKMGKTHFSQYENSQSPIATILTCSDSRVQLSKIYTQAENKLFVIRNIGNQVDTAAGSIEFGINYLKTPVCMVLGHSYCGAVQAVCESTPVSHPVAQELATMNIQSKHDVICATIENIQNQTNTIIKRYFSKVENRVLTVIGAFYDFSNLFHYGHGRVIFVNINGENNTNKIKNHECFRDLEHAYFLK